MRRFVAPALAVLGSAILGLTGCAPKATGAGLASPNTPRTCFQADQVQNFRTDGTQTLYVRAIDRQVYELNASGFCRGLDAATGIAIRAQAGSGSRLCTGDWALIGAGPEPCRARVARVLTAAEVEALPSRYRP